MEKSKFDLAYEAIKDFEKREIEAATLRAVGEALASLVTETGTPLFIDYKHVDALRQGKMPEGW